MKDTDLNSTRLQHSDLATADQRIAAWSKWFDLDAPHLDHEDGNILLTDELYDWILSSQASFDWVFFGDPHGMAAAFKREVEQISPFREAFAKLEAPEQSIVVEALRAHQEDGLSFDDAMSQMKEGIDAHRRQNIAAV